MRCRGIAGCCWERPHRGRADNLARALPALPEVHTGSATQLSTDGSSQRHAIGALAAVAGDGSGARQIKRSSPDHCCSVAQGQQASPCNLIWACCADRRCHACARYTWRCWWAHGPVQHESQTCWPLAIVAGRNAAHHITQLKSAILHAGRHAPAFNMHARNTRNRPELLFPHLRTLQLCASLLAVPVITHVLLMSHDCVHVQLK